MKSAFCVDLNLMCGGRSAGEANNVVSHPPRLARQNKNKLAPGKTFHSQRAAEAGRRNGGANEDATRDGERKSDFHRWSDLLSAGEERRGERGEERRGKERRGERGDRKSVV